MEFVYVVHRRHLFGDHYPQGLVPFGQDLPREAFLEAVQRDGFFVEREYAERTPTLKQVIPYTLVTREQNVLLLRRLKAGGEGRLHDKLSIGVGGHVNPVDDQASTDELRSHAASSHERRASLLSNATRRELEEELVLEGSWNLESVGLINDDSNPVGAVHVGLVQVLTTDAAVEIRERDVLEGQLVTPDALRDKQAEGANYETWSSMLVDRLDELLPSTFTRRAASGSSNKADRISLAN